MQLDLQPATKEPGRNSRRTRENLLSFVERIREMASNGGIVIRAEALLADGSVREPGIDIAVYDFLVSEKAILYILAGADRVHGQQIFSAREEGDEVYLDCGPSMRLVIGLAVLPQEQAGYEYARTHRSLPLIEEMQSLFAAMNKEQR